jgi:hypothetical protein
MNGRWSPPEVASFSGTKYTDYDPFISPDGLRLFFISTRPNGDQPKQPNDYDIWVVDRQGNGWSEPHNLGAPVNTERPEYYPSVARNGTLYFSSNREGGQGSFDVYRSRFVHGQYQTPENLGPAVNSATAEIDNYIAADESYLVFAGYNRQGAPGLGDLYVSFFENGAWTPARLLGHGINSPAREYCPIGSQDGHYLYWTSKRGFVDSPRTRGLTMPELRDSLRSVLNGQGNIYRIPIAALRGE